MRKLAGFIGKTNEMVFLCPTLANRKNKENEDH
jgi:hypothetical protein